MTLNFPLESTSIRWIENPAAWAVAIARRISVLRNRFLLRGVRFLLGGAGAITGSNAKGKRAPLGGLSHHLPWLGAISASARSPSVIVHHCPKFCNIRRKKRSFMLARFAQRDGAVGVGQGGSVRRIEQPPSSRPAGEKHSPASRTIVYGALRRALQPRQQTDDRLCVPFRPG